MYIGKDMQVREYTQELGLRGDSLEKMLTILGLNAAEMGSPHIRIQD